MFLLLPALVLMELTSDDQKHSLLDIFKIPSQDMSSQESYFCVIMLPLLVYMPGDAAVLTMASYNKQSHNPLITSFMCLVAKWFVAYMFLHILFFAEGLASDQRCKLPWHFCSSFRTPLQLRPLQGGGALQRTTGWDNMA